MEGQYDPLVMSNMNNPKDIYKYCQCVVLCVCVRERLCEYNMQ